MRATLGYLATQRRARKPWVERLFAQQLAFFNDPTGTKAAFCTRRAGKTEVDTSGLVDAIQRDPTAIALYCTLTSKTSYDNQWAAIEVANRRYGLGLEPNSSKGRWYTPEGGCIWLTGCEDITEADKFRGLRYSIVIIDEMGTFRSAVVRYLIKEVLSAARSDNDCPLWLTGTPGKVPNGYWYGLTTGKEPGVEPVPTHCWSVLDNPHHKLSAPGALEAYRIKEGFKPDDPAWIREYLGQWCLDHSTLIYTPTEINEWDGWSPGERRVHTIIGVDLGYHDATAFTVTQAESGLPTVYVTESYGRPHMLPNDIAAEIMRLQSRYPGADFYVDSGGLGKTITAQLQQDYGLPVNIAEKQDKAGAISRVQAAIRKGQLKVHPANARELLAEWHELPWNEDHTGHAEGFRDHCSDALLYAYRKHVLEESWDLDPPKPGSPDWAKAEADKMRAAALKRTAQTVRRRF